MPGGLVSNPGKGKSNKKSPDQSMPGDAKYWTREVVKDEPPVPLHEIWGTGKDPTSDLQLRGRSMPKASDENQIKKTIGSKEPSQKGGSQTTTRDEGLDRSGRPYPRREEVRAIASGEVPSRSDERSEIYQLANTAGNNSEIDENAKVPGTESSEEDDEEDEDKSENEVEDVLDDPLENKDNENSDNYDDEDSDEENAEEDDGDKEDAIIGSEKPEPSGTPEEGGWKTVSRSRSGELLYTLASWGSGYREQ